MHRRTAARSRSTNRSALPHGRTAATARKAKRKTATLQDFGSVLYGVRNAVSFYESMGVSQPFTTRFGFDRA